VVKRSGGLRVELRLRDGPEIGDKQSKWTDDEEVDVPRDVDGQAGVAFLGPPTL
jgi:hypothetical protein